MFNTILREAGLPLKDIRLIRHKDKSAKRGYTPYELWRDRVRGDLKLYFIWRFENVLLIVCIFFAKLYFLL
jgi:hypothetical protein